MLKFYELKFFKIIKLIKTQQSSLDVTIQEEHNNKLNIIIKNGFFKKCD